MLQGHLLRQNRLRWAMHMALCYGVLLLVLRHALAPTIFEHLITAIGATAVDWPLRLGLALGLPHDSPGLAGNKAV